MRLLLAAVVLAPLLACGSVMYANEARDNCGPTPSPLNADTCFGDFLKSRVQSSDSRAPNFVPAECPCGAFVPGYDAGADAGAD